MCVPPRHSWAPGRAKRPSADTEPTAPAADKSPVLSGAADGPSRRPAHSWAWAGLLRRQLCNSNSGGHRLPIQSLLSPTQNSLKTHTEEENQENLDGGCCPPASCPDALLELSWSLPTNVTAPPPPPCGNAPFATLGRSGLCWTEENKQQILAPHES